MGEAVAMRKQNWPVLLTRGIDDWKAAQFYWGQADCVHFAVMIAASFLEDDLIAALGGVIKFASEREAQEYFIAQFDGKIENIFDRALTRRPSSTFASRGDLVVVDYNGQEIAGIVADGGTLIAAKAKTGLAYLPVSAAKIAWVTE